MDSDLALLRLVFSFHVIDHIIHADEHIDPLEIDWMRERYPREVLEEHGLIDEESRLTDTFRDLLAEALMRLPKELSEDEKRQLALTFFDSAMADGEFEAREGKQLEAAAHLLGLPLKSLHEALDSSDDVGAIELDDPELF